MGEQVKLKFIDTRPILELVSMNLSLTCSRAFLLVCTNKDLRRVNTRFLGPMQQPLIMTKSCLTNPMGEPTHGVDRLISQIIIGSSIVLHKLAILHVESITDVINLLVDLGTVMVTLLTGASDGELDSAWMPGTNTSDHAKTFVSLSWQLLGMPT